MPDEMDMLTRLNNQVRWLKICVIGFGALLGVLLLTAASRQTTFGTLTAERIDIVDAAGKTRLVIANADRFPPVLLNGKTLKRSINPAGLVFFDAAGNEVGGLAITDLAPGRVLALAFDNPNFDAIGLQNRISHDGKDATAGLVINSRAAESLTPAEASRVVAQRVAVENHNETAQVVLADPAGRPRLRLSVDPAGQPLLEMLDEQGKATYRIEAGGAGP